MPARSAAAVLAVLALCVVLTTVLTPPAEAQAGSYACRSGFVWREAYDGDVVCVTPASREKARAEKVAGPGNTLPGSINCRSGYVWREARPSDLVCVSGGRSPTPRDRVRAENADAARNLANAGNAPYGGFFITEMLSNSHLHTDVRGSGATPGGTVVFYSIPAPGSVRQLGVALTASSVGEVRGRLQSMFCPNYYTDDARVVALDLRTGTVTRAGTTSIYTCTEI